jgi:predicted O-methyltransferase YrrM
MRALIDGRPALPWSDWAMTPAGLTTVCMEIASRARREVVELGSGVSTILIARLLSERAGHLTSVEHDPGWAAQVGSLLARERLEGLATLIVAPLRSHPLARGDAEWYEPAALARLPERIDLLLVDGPPASSPEIAESRYPALPGLGERIARDGVVVLDDIDRPGERSILATWEAELDFAFERRPAERIAIGRRG